MGKLARATLPPVLLTLTVVTVLLTGTALLARRNRSIDVAPRWMRYLEPAMVSAIGGAVTVFAVWTGHQSESHSRLESFNRLAEGKTAALAETVLDVRGHPTGGLGESLHGKG